MIFLFTLSFPYTVGREDTFISYEVNQLVRYFKCVEILPSITNGEKYDFDKSLIINHDLSKSLLKRGNLLFVLFSGTFYELLIKEFFCKPDIFFSIKKFKKLVSYLINTVVTEKWIIEKLLQRVTMSNEKVIMYTYWFTYITTALCHVFGNIPNVRIITRAHGIDLFEFRNNNYLPLRHYTINILDRFYFVSEYGRNYMIQKYPEYKQKYKTFPLGVTRHGLINIMPKEGKYHFVSCSTIDANKRIELIIDSLYLFALKNPTLIIQWTHFGDGPLFKEIVARVKEYRSQNFFVKLKGQQSTQQIFSFYSHEPINSFITTTASEGGRPLSVQEALSFGIPVIATNVGGISELINEKNSYLLSANPDIKEIETALNRVIFDFRLWNKKRVFCLETWEEKCNSLRLTNDFITDLKTL